MTIQAVLPPSRRLNRLRRLAGIIGHKPYQWVIPGMASAALPTLALAAVLASASAMAQLVVTNHTDLATAMMACQSYFAGGGVFCDLGGDKTCHYQWSLPACAIIEQRYNAPDGPAASARAEQKRALDRARELIGRLAE